MSESQPNETNAGMFLALLQYKYTNTLLLESGTTASTVYSIKKKKARLANISKSLAAMRSIWNHYFTDDAAATPAIETYDVPIVAGY